MDNDDLAVGGPGGEGNEQPEEPKPEEEVKPVGSNLAIEKPPEPTASTAGIGTEPGAEDEEGGTEDEDEGEGEDEEEEGEGEGDGLIAMLAPVKEPQLGMAEIMRQTKTQDAEQDQDTGTTSERVKKMFQKKGGAKPKAKKKPKRPRLTFENTYRLIPEREFIPSYVKNCIDTTLKEMVPKASYDSSAAGIYAGVIAERIRNRVLGCRFSRYKIVVLVSIAQRRHQGIHCGSRCLWSPTYDKYAVSEIRTQRMVCFAVVYGLYYE